MTPPGFAEQKTSLVVHREAGAEDCPNAEQLARQVHAIVDRDVIGPGPGNDAAWIDVTMSKNQTGYQATLRTFGHSVGQREFSDPGEDCSALADAVAVSLALMWTSQEGDLTAAASPPASEGDPSAPEESTEPSEPVPTKPPATPKKKAATKPKAQSLRKTPSTEVAMGLDAFVGASVEVLEHAAPSAEAAFRVEVGQRASFGALAGWTGTDRVLLDDGEVNLTLLYGALRACGAILLGEPRLLLCARPMLGELAGRGSGFDRSWHRRHLYSALAVSLEVRGTMTRSFAWVAELVALAPLERHSFSVQEEQSEQPAFTTPNLGFSALLGVSWESH